MRNQTVKAISETTGIHWGVIRRLHKGHTYATCVMDIDTGEILWAGNGRGISDFKEFFKAIDMDYLKDVKAVAMDMNAAFHQVIREKLPHARIVYDRFHMQARYGRDVLGTTRMDEAREHRKKADELRREAAFTAAPWLREDLEAAEKQERATATQIKKNRWTILRRQENLSENQKNALEKILSEHVNLMVCYALKEKMCRLFELRDPREAEEGWTAWFEAAKAGKVENLMTFARLKESRLDGLIEHARHPISTGRLEGMNNKIKVCKRIAYGYQDDEYFFSLVRYLTLPKFRKCSPVIP